MMKSLKNMFKQDKEKYVVPKCVHDYIPVSEIWEDGIFKVGNKFTKTFKFADINYHKRNCKVSLHSSLFRNLCVL